MLPKSSRRSRRCSGSKIIGRRKRSINAMKNTADLAELEKWTGDVSELARLAGEVLASCGFADASAEPNVRLIRDYAQRGIVSRAERQGKEAIYGYRQLLEFVAARVLVADGWPLAKIAEHFAHMADAKLRSLISADQGRNRALAVARRLRGETGLGSAGRPGKLSRSPLPDRSKEFRERVARLSGIQNEMREALRRLGLPENGPATEQLTLLAVAPWCQVLVESQRLSRITMEEAEEIGRAVTASLLTVSKKGIKP
jgi:hypothetical protein